MIVNPPCASRAKGNIGFVLLFLLGLLVFAGLASWFLFRAEAQEPMVDQGPTGFTRETLNTTTGQNPNHSQENKEDTGINLGKEMPVSDEVWRMLITLLPDYHQETLRAYTTAWEKDSSSRLEVSRRLTSTATTMLDQGKGHDALIMLDEAIRFHEDDGLPTAWKARILLRFGERAQALALVSAALESFPNSLTLLRLAAEIARLEGQDELSAAYLERALAIDADAPGLAFELAQAKQDARVMSTFLTDATAHFDLRYDPQAMKVAQALPELGAVVEEAWQDVLAATGLLPKQRILIMLLEPSSYRASAPDWSSGLYDGRVRVVVEDPAQELDTLARTLRHELTHAALFTIGVNLPTWIHEGLAQQVEGGSVEYARQSLREQDAFLLSSADLAGDWTRWQEQERVREAYFYSLSLTAWLGEEYGGEVWANLFQNLQGRAYEDAWQLTFGQGFEELNEKHREDLR